MEIFSVELIRSSGTTSMIILTVLFLMSVGVWGIAFYKFAANRGIRRRIRAWEKEMGGRPDIRMLRSLSATQDHPLARLSASALEEIHGMPDHLHSDVRERMIEARLDQSIDMEMGLVENNLGYLITCATLGPLLGLFGTISGIMNSFLSIGMMGSANITVVAPGIAEALLTTLAGLLLAIPALIFYNHFLNQNRRLLSSMNQFAFDFANRFRRGDLTAATTVHSGTVRA